MTGGPAWHLLTGEYPPQPGGVSDYTRLVAAGLARSGADVRIWTTPAAGPTPEDPGVAVDREAGRWSPAGLARLGAALDARPGPRRLLVQYAPNCWGYRGVNLGFGRWLCRRRAAGDEVWAMVHEAYYGWYLRDKPSRWLLAAAHRLMVRDLIAASARLYVSRARMVGELRRHEAGPPRPIAWLPVPCTVPPVDDPGAAASIRRRYAPAGGPLVGSFGTFAPGPPRQLLRAALGPVLDADPARSALLIGRNSDHLAAELRAERPDWAGRVDGTGGLEPAEVSRHLAACDLMLQPYDDGVSTRRTTVMAGLEHGRAIATNAGHNTEPIWAESGCVALADGPDMPALARAADALLRDPSARARLGAAAREVYRRNFSVECTVAALLGADPAGVGRAG